MSSLTPTTSAGSSPFPPNLFAGSAVSPSSSPSKLRTIASSAVLSVPRSDSSSTPKPQLAWTTVDGTIRTLKTFREFILLLNRVMESGPTNNMPDIVLEEHVKFFEGTYQDDIKKVAERQAGIRTLAQEHPLILMDFRTFLRGVLEDVGKCNLLTELEEIEKTLKRRPPLSKPKESSSAPAKEQELPPLPPSLAKAWENIGLLGELQAELSSLKTNFEFLQDDEYAKDMFAHEYCQNAALQFLDKFQGFTVNSAHANDTKKDWQKSELISVTKAVEAAYASIKKEIEATTRASEVHQAYLTIKEINGKTKKTAADEKALEKAYDLIKSGIEEKKFLPSQCDLDDCELSDRVTIISSEFEANHPSSEQVNTFRRLYQSIQRLKATIEIENKCEKQRGDDRNYLHQLRVKEIAQLKEEVEALQIGTTMQVITDLMDKAKKASHDIKTMFGRVEETLSVFDSIVSKSTSALADETK